MSGWAYDFGKGIQKCSEKALEYYLKGFLSKLEFFVFLFFTSCFFCVTAAQLKNDNALRNVGILYQEGLGIEKDMKKAVELFTECANLGNHYGINSLALMYENGEGLFLLMEIFSEFILFEKKGVEQNYETAFKLYEESAKLGNDFAICNLGNM